MAVKSVSAKELYAEYFALVRSAIESAIESGDSVAAIAARIGVDRNLVNHIRNGSYSSTINSTLLIAFDLEFELGIFKK